jgi:hypothetical protein
MDFTVFTLFEENKYVLKRRNLIPEFSWQTGIKHPCFHRNVTPQRSTLPDNELRCRVKYFVDG